MITLTAMVAMTAMTGTAGFIPFASCLNDLWCCCLTDRA